MADPLSVRRRFGHQLRVALGLSACLCVAGPAHAEHLPVWELGIGIGTLNTPHYRGSDSEADLILPFPYVIYRGSFLQIDREEGVRGRLTTLGALVYLCNHRFLSPDTQAHVDSKHSIDKYHG